MICIHCGKNISDGSLICAICGKNTDYPSRYNYIPSKIPVIQKRILSDPVTGTPKTSVIYPAADDASRETVREKTERAVVTPLKEGGKPTQVLLEEMMIPEEKMDPEISADPVLVEQNQS